MSEERVKEYKCSHYRIILAGYGRCSWKRRKQEGEKDTHTLCKATHHRNRMYIVQEHRLLQKKVIIIFQKACIQQGSVLPKLFVIYLILKQSWVQFMPEENFHESLTVENKSVKFIIDHFPPLIIKLQKKIHNVKISVSPFMKLVWAEQEDPLNK